MSRLVNSVAKLVRAEPADLLPIFLTAPFRYKTYQIPKRSGKGFRTIAQPAAEVKELQRLVVASVINDWPLHSAATAYRKGVSTAEHARRHSSTRFLLKLDFKNFFPSIDGSSVAQHIRRHTLLEDEDVRLLTQLLTYRDKTTRQLCLSIGAPSSPFISNSMLFEFDEEMATYCSQSNVRYSRYADDLAFSTDTPGKLKDVQRQVEETVDRIAYPRLRLNAEKTVNTSRGSHRNLVGLVLTPDGAVSLGREKKRRVRAQMHHYICGRLVPEEVGTLRGILSYLWSVEPSFVRRLVEQYGTEAFDSLGAHYGQAKPHKTRKAA